MKPRRLTTARLSFPLAFAIAALLAAPVARATSYYWDANGVLTTAVAPTGIWGTSSFWTTDPLGASATAAYAGDNTSDIYFCAGTLGTTGTVTVSGTQNASSITFDDPVAITLSGGTALNIGGTGVSSGIFVTANAVNTISTAITLNAAATIQNAGTSNQTISGGITGGQNLILKANGTGGLLFTTTAVNNAGTITNSGTSTGTNVITTVGSNVTSLIQNSNGSGLTVTTLNLASPGTTLTANGTKGITITNNLAGMTGNVTLNNNTASNALFNIGGSATTGTINNGGTITFSGTGAGNQTFGTVGSAVTGLIQSASNSAATFTVTNQITGGGDFTLSDNSSSTAALTLTNGFNNTGTLTNNGTGGGLVTVGVIGTNVTNVIQNSSTSQMTLSGANTYNNANGYNITAGTLKISNATSFTNAAKFTLASGGRLDVAAADADLSKLATANGGSGVVAGSTLKYSAAQTAAATNGPGTIYGTVELAVTGVNPGYPLDFGTGGTLLNTATSTSTIPLTFSGDFTINSNTASATYSTGGITSSATGGTQTLILGGSNTGTISSIIGDGSTGGKVAVEKTGAGTWTLTGANTFTGGLNILAGTVYGAVPLSFGAGNITLGDTSGNNAATLSVNASGSVTYANPTITVANGTSGILTIAMGNQLGGASAFPQTFTGAIALNNNLTVSNPVANNLVLSGLITEISDDNPYTITFSTGANNRIQPTGGIVIGTGGLTLQNNGSLITVGSSTGNITSTTTGNLTFNSNSNGGFTVAAASSVNHHGTITNSGTGTGGTTISGAIGSNVTSGVTQNNVNNTLTLSSGSNAFTGGVFIKAGTVSLGDVNAANGVNNTIYLGDATVGANATLYSGKDVVTFLNPIIVASGSGTRTIGVHAGATAGNFGGAITLNHDLIVFDDAASNPRGVNLSGNITGTGNISLLANFTASIYSITLSGASINNTGSITNSGTSTNPAIISGNIVNSSASVIQNSSTSKLVLSGTNTYTGATTITLGTLQLGNAGATGSLSPSSAITNDGTLAFNRTNTLTQGTDFANGISGSGGITQAGTGTTILNSVNTYTGATAVNVGTLVLGGGSGKSPITVSGTAFLGFTPGSPVTSTSSVTLVSGAKIKVTTPPVTPNSYTLMTASGGITGTPVLNTAITDYTLALESGNTVLKLNYTGAAGNPYDLWSGSATFDADANNDGVKNGLAWLLGATNKDANATGRLPIVSQSGGDLVLTFTCLKVAGRGSAVLKLQYSKDLGIADQWTTHEVVVPDAAGTVGSVTFTIPSTNPDPTLVNLQATIPASEATPGTKLFGRLEGYQP